MILCRQRTFYRGGFLFHVVVVNLHVEAEVAPGCYALAYVSEADYAEDVVAEVVAYRGGVEVVVCKGGWGVGCCGGDAPWYIAECRDDHGDGEVGYCVC